MGPLDQQPPWWGQRGLRETWSKAAGAERAKDFLEGDQQNPGGRGDRGGEEGEMEDEGWESRGARKGEGLSAAGRRGRGARLRWEEAGALSLPGCFSLMLTGSYLLSI